VLLNCTLIPDMQIKTTSQSSISVPIATTTASSTENGVLASNNKSGSFIVCPVFSGGLGNMMFDFLLYMVFENKLLLKFFIILIEIQK
jgi:hypothetical protein